MTDRCGKVILVGIENHRHASDEKIKSVIKEVFDMVESLPSSNLDLNVNR